MSLKLNKLDDAVVLKTLAFNEKSLADMLAPNSKARQRSEKAFAHAVGEAYLDIGLAYYQQQKESDKIRETFALASNHLTKDVSLPPVKNGARPWEFERIFALASCFAPREDVDRALGVPDDLIFAPVNEEAKRTYRLSLDYLNLLRKYISSGNLDLELCSKIETECKAENSSKFDSVDNDAKLNALRAVFQSNAQLWNQSLETLVQSHKDEATKGDLQRLNQAFIALPALLIAKLGIAKGLKCTVSSPYLPVELL